MLTVIIHEKLSPMLQKTTISLTSHHIFADLNVKTTQQQVKEFSPCNGRQFVLKPVSVWLYLPRQQQLSSQTEPPERGPRSAVRNTVKNVSVPVATVCFVPPSFHRTQCQIGACICSSSNGVLCPTIVPQYLVLDRGLYPLQQQRCALSHYRSTVPSARTACFVPLSFHSTQCQNGVLCPTNVPQYLVLDRGLYQLQQQRRALSHYRSTVPSARTACFVPLSFHSTQCQNGVLCPTIVPQYLVLGRCALSHHRSTVPSARTVCLVPLSFHSTQSQIEAFKRECGRMRHRRFTVDPGRRG